MIYGDKVLTEYGRITQRVLDVVGNVTTAPSGNVVLETGKLVEDGWEKAGHIVLGPDEAVSLATEILANSQQQQRPRFHLGTFDLIKKGWIWRCTCGERSSTFGSREQAADDFDAHLFTSQSSSPITTDVPEESRS